MPGKADSTTNNDAAVIAAAQRNPADFEKVYQTYVQSVFKYLYSHTGSRQDAEELTAQTFLSAIERLPSYRHRGYFPAWLFSIARNKAADLFRRRSRLAEAELLEDMPSGNDLPEDFYRTKRIEDLSKIIQSLPEAEQELLRLRFVADLSFVQIAAIQGRKLDAVKKTPYRLLSRLHSQLEIE